MQDAKQRCMFFKLLFHMQKRFSSVIKLTWLEGRCEMAVSIVTSKVLNNRWAAVLFYMGAWRHQQVQMQNKSLFCFVHASPKSKGQVNIHCYILFMYIYIPFYVSCLTSKIK